MDLPVLRGRRALLRPWRADDEEAVLAACRDPEVARWTRVPSPYRREDARSFLERYVPDVRAAGGAAFCVEDLARPGEVAGSMTAMGVDTDRVAEAGYWIAPGARGRGLARDALALLVRWCFDAGGVERLALFVEPDNHRSLRVGLAAGFVREGVLRRRLLIDGERRDVVVLGLLPDDLDAGGP